MTHANNRSRSLRASIMTLTMLGGMAAALLYVTGVAGASTTAVSNTVRPVNGAPAFGPDPGLKLNGNFVDIAATPGGHGYWVTAADGGVFARGDAHFYGSAASVHLLGPVVGIAPTPSGNGYWLAAADGGVFTYGDAHFYGSLGGYHLGSRPLNGAITGIAPTPSGHGYWLVGADGGVFRFGDAGFFGSAGAIRHPMPFTAIASTKSGHGYYLLEADGGVFTFGDAHFYGSAVDGHISKDMSVLPNGQGYQIARLDGAVIGFGGASSSAAPWDPTWLRHPVVGIASRGSGGAWLARGDAPPPPPPPPADISGDSFLRCTRAHESDSAGGYRAVAPPYYGAYQFNQSTWDNTARHAGRPDLVGVRPDMASPHDQDALAMDLYHWQGAGPWGGRCAGLP
jgi:hypothetical protein